MAPLLQPHPRPGRPLGGKEWARQHYFHFADGSTGKHVETRLFPTLGVPGDEEKKQVEHHKLTGASEGRGWSQQSMSGRGDVCNRQLCFCHHCYGCFERYSEDPCRPSRVGRGAEMQAVRDSVVFP